ncbi:unnamed protein product [Candida verbasci]|uniref:Uncharacterized protein n=1 Tax=Candida verbasci TaxID=1227364 RepID=A0A9W4U289_9ASCO|nr:unnamed protein product [Candida verbasci]
MSVITPQPSQAPMNSINFNSLKMKKPLSPQPSRPVLSCLQGGNSLIKSTTPTPRSTPFPFLSNESEDEFDDSESIISESYSFMTNNDISHRDQDATNYKTISPTPVQSKSSISEFLPIFYSNDSASSVLSTYFSNQVFYAHNLIQLSQHFMNQEFEFSRNLILNPKIPNHEHELIITHLNSIYNYSIDLTSTISIFNAMVDKVNITEVSIENLKLIKFKFDNLINNHLSEQVHHLLDLIIEELYEYNLLIDDLNEEEHVEEENDEENLNTINDLYSSIESILQLKTSKLTSHDVSKFHDLLHESIIENNEWNDFINHMRKTM